MIGNEQIKIDPNQMEEIIELLAKEESLEFAEKIEKQIEKEQRQQEVVATKELNDEAEQVIENIEESSKDKKEEGKIRSQQKD